MAADSGGEDAEHTLSRHAGVGRQIRLERNVLVLTHLLPMEFRQRTDLSGKLLRERFGSAMEWARSGLYFRSRLTAAGGGGRNSYGEFRLWRLYEMLKG